MRICDKGSQLRNVEFDSYHALTAGCIGIDLKFRGQHDRLFPGDNGSALGTPMVSSASLGSGSLTADIRDSVVTDQTTSAWSPKPHNDDRNGKTAQGV